MEKILTKLRIKRKDNQKCPQKHPSTCGPTYDTDSDFVLNTDRSISYDCKRLSVSYTLIGDPIEDNKPLKGSTSSVKLSHDLNNSKNIKTKQRKTMFWLPKPNTINTDSKKSSKSLRQTFLSVLRIGTKKSAESETGLSDDSKLHVVWYAPDVTTHAKCESKVDFNNSLSDYKRQKELFTTIAEELETKTRSKSLNLNYTNRLSGFD